MQLTSVTSGVGTATKSVCVRVWRQGYVALDTRWVPTGVKEILKSIQVAFVCVCVTYHKNFRSTVKIMVLNVRLK